MKLNVAAPVASPELSAMLATVGVDHMAQGTLYAPFMQLLLSPAGQGEDSVLIWELTQKLYAGKDGEVELSPGEVAILKTKVESVSLPWLRARLLEVLA